jgi:hypothetical protein
VLGAHSGCAGIRAERPLTFENSLVREQLVIHSDFDLPAHHRLIDELVAQRADLSAKLDLPISDEPIHVYLFGTRERYQEYLRKHHPDFPARRAVFVESDTHLAVYAYWGDRVAEDLRHEVAHGYLHATVPGLPLWLDEGLAEYFEVPRGRGGWNRPHVDMLVGEGRRAALSPDLARLEKLRAAGDMTQRDYAESWAWVHFLLETTPERRRLLHAYLDELRDNGSAPPLSARLAQYGGLDPAAVAEHLRDAPVEK